MQTLILQQDFVSILKLYFCGYRKLAIFKHVNCFEAVILLKEGHITFSTS